MRRLEDLNSIIREATEPCSEEVQTLADELLQRFLRNPKPIEEFCHVIKQEIRLLLSPRHRREARQALQRIQNGITSGAMENAVAEENNRRCAERMKREMLRTFDLVNRLKRGIVCMGSAQIDSDRSEYKQAQEFAREVSILLGSTVWAGGGPGIMDASVRGGRAADGSIGGIKINLESEQNVSPVLRANEVEVCEYFAPRKVGLVDAAMRPNENVRTAAVFFPGGFGTLDELFEFLTLKQQGKLGTDYDVPIIIMNFNGAFDHLLEHIDRIAQSGFIKEEHKKLYKVCQNNQEALDYLADYYDIPKEERKYADRLQDWQKAA